MAYNTMFSLPVQAPYQRIVVPQSSYQPLPMANFPSPLNNVCNAEDHVDYIISSFHDRDFSNPMPNSDLTLLRFLLQHWDQHYLRVKFMVRSPIAMQATAHSKLSPQSKH